MLLNLLNLFPSPAGEWKARFDPRFTSRGVFYLDEQQMVEVEVMEDAKHPLSLFIDNELEAQVQNKKTTKITIYFSSICQGTFFITRTSFLSTGSEIPFHEVHESVGGHAAVRPGGCGVTHGPAKHFRPVLSHAKGESNSCQSSEIQAGIRPRVTGCFDQIR